MATLTKRERELMTPGTCTRCGKYEPHGRNSAGMCIECHNANYYEQRARRKQQLAEHNAKIATEGQAALAEADCQPGDDVRYFAQSWFGLGGEMITGTIVLRKGIPYVKLDRKHSGRRYVLWNKSWKKR